ncbi:MAG: hypothetical protein IPJ23_09500 [Ignavibacteriales bacterium]|nr:hypothetical protein [Ignavibacteriales bacterium]
MLNKYNTFIFDLDGTVYRGENIIPNADKTINYLKKLGKKILFISNKTTGTIKDYYLFLKGFGLNIEETEILNSTIVLKNYLISNHPKKQFYAIGEQIFIDELVDSGLNYSANPKEIQILIVTLDRTLNYDKLEIAAKALENGARFLQQTLMILVQLMAAKFLMQVQQFQH